MLNEAIFGGFIQKTETKLSLSVETDGSFRLNQDEKDPLALRLKAEADLLNPNHLPEILKVEQAWVYLDKGRAYGLEIGDRLLIREGTEPITGHVVGFYRSKGDIVSKLSLPIAEERLSILERDKTAQRSDKDLNLTRPFTLQS